MIFLSEIFSQVSVNAKIFTEVTINAKAFFMIFFYIRLLRRKDTYIAFLQQKWREILSLSTSVSCQLICRLDAHLGELQTRSSVAHLAVDAVDAEVAVVGVGPPVPGLDVAPQRPDDAGAGGEAGPHVASGGGAAPRVPGLERGLG